MQISALKENHINIETALNKLSINETEKPVVRAKPDTLVTKVDKFELVSLMIM